MRELVYGRHLGTRAFHNCKLCLLERVANLPSSGRANVRSAVRRLIDELIEHISGIQRCMCGCGSTLPGCARPRRDAAVQVRGVHAACGAAHAIMIEDPEGNK
eukprot:4783863-Prymnesium_polylepis.1